MDILWEIIFFVFFILINVDLLLRLSSIIITTGM
jgi:hypothetical protein